MTIESILFLSGLAEIEENAEILVGNCEDIAFVEVFFCVKRHIIIFKEEVGKVIVDASTSEFDNGFFLCPKTGEGDLRIGS